jgi:hypothetical protein
MTLSIHKRIYMHKRCATSHERNKHMWATILLKKNEPSTITRMHYQHATNTLTFNDNNTFMQHLSTSTSITHNLMYCGRDCYGTCSTMTYLSSVCFKFSLGIRAQDAPSVRTYNNLIKKMMKMNMMKSAQKFQSVCDTLT